MGIQIREAESEEDKLRCYALRYQIYVEEMEREQEFADHARKITREPYDDHGVLLIAEDEGEIVATLRMNRRIDGPLECEELYELDRFGPFYPDDVSMLTKFVVVPEYRQSGVAGRMAVYAYKYGRERGVKLNFIDAYPHLVQLYQQLGYRMYTRNIQHPDYGSVIPMVLLLEDIEYLQEIRSPFVRYARNYVNRSDTREYFDEHFPEYASIRPLFASHEDNVMDLFSSQFANATKTSFGFLEGFTAEEANALLKNLAILSYEPGEYVFRQGDESLGMFGVLKGQVEVIRESDRGDKVLAILNESDIFGEMGFIAKTRRTATIRVRESTDLLVIAPSDLKKVLNVTPDLGIRFLLNMYKIVVERYIHVMAS